MFFTKRRPRQRLSTMFFTNRTPDDIAADDARFAAKASIYRDYEEAVRTKAAEAREATRIEREVMRNLHDWMSGKARIIANHKVGAVFEYVFEPSKETDADVRQASTE